MHAGIPTDYISKVSQARLKSWSSYYCWRFEPNGACIDTFFLVTMTTKYAHHTWTWIVSCTCYISTTKILIRCIVSKKIFWGAFHLKWFLGFPVWELHYMEPSNFSTYSLYLTNKPICVMLRWWSNKRRRKRSVFRSTEGNHSRCWTKRKRSKVSHVESDMWGISKYTHTHTYIYI